MKRFNAHGLGAWQGIKLKNRGELNKVRELAQEKNLLLGAGFNNTLMYAQSLT